MRNYFMLESEANYRQCEHERRIKAAADDALAARTNASGPRLLRQMLALARFVSVRWLPILVAPSLRLSLGEDRARS